MHASMCKWYRKHGINYLSKIDPEKCTEIDLMYRFLLSDTLNIEKKRNGTIKSLKKNGYIDILEKDEQESKCALTEKGKKLIKTIKIRKCVPETYVIRGIISDAMNYHSLDEESLVNLAKIDKQRVKSVLSIGTLFDLGDAIIIFKALDLNFFKVIADYNRKGVVDIYGNYNVNKLKSKLGDLEIESPIEELLLNEILKYQKEHSLYIDTQKNFKINDNHYRGDIYIEATDDIGVKKILIECDGHEFHEKTKQQAARDKQRDRHFLSIGIIPIRFTGSEIWKDADKCAKEILDILQGQRRSSIV